MVKCRTVGKKMRNIFALLLAKPETKPETSREPCRTAYAPLALVSAWGKGQRNICAAWERGAISCGPVSGMAGRQRYCEVEDKFSRSTSAILDARLQCQQVSSGSQPRDTVALDLQNTRAMTVPHRKVNDDVLNGMEVGYMEANRSGGITIAAECGLCLDEFLDTGNKVPRNLLCGHTFCTG